MMEQPQYPAKSPLLEKPVAGRAYHTEFSI
jgi:hypothetical protein